MEITEEELNERIKTESEKAALAARIEQANHDRICADGNAFFAEALDHIGGLARTSEFWANAYNCGLLLKQEFEVNTGQKTRLEQKPPEQKQPE